MSTCRIEFELGHGYSQRILDYLASDSVVEYGFAPMWRITANLNWQNKSYWVRKALKELHDTNQVELFKHRRSSVGWCYSLAGKMNRRR